MFSRRYIAAMQACLTQLDYDPGIIDRREGVFTREMINRLPLPSASTADALPHQRDVEAACGTPGADIKSKMVCIELPFDLRID
ncbi:hypothetical protein OO012_08235 [Rhodobacteraceae bacterium KMM 6894]|nr:hypothetical protein [Rhodobacteraceae bacterium KMM 6894]